MNRQQAFQIGLDAVQESFSNTTSAENWVLMTLDRVENVGELSSNEIAKLFQNYLSKEVAAIDAGVEPKPWECASHIKKNSNRQIGDRPKVTKTFRVDPDLLEGLQSRAERDGVTQVEVLEAALKSFLG